MNNTLSKLEELALRFYERRLSEAEQVRREFNAECCAAPDWTRDREQMRRDAWTEALDFLRVGDGADRLGYVGTVLTPDPLDERDGGPTMTRQDWLCLRGLPVGTRIYAALPASHSHDHG